MSSSRPDRRRRDTSALEQAQEARGLLQEQFFRIDQLQRDVGSTVESYAQLLPDRARSTGVIPAWRRLDERANTAVNDYLALLDEHDPVEDLDPYRVHAATSAFGRGTEPLRALADEMERFLDSYGAELARTGEVRARVEARVRAAQSAVTAAEQAWRAMQETGIAAPEADEALARARVAGRKLAEIADRLGPEAVEEPASVVERLAEEARRLSVEVPQRLANLSNRIGSLTTRIEAIATRAERAQEHMSALRREFSHASWRDLAGNEKELDQQLSTARASLARLRQQHAAGATTASLTELDTVENAVAAASEAVDAPWRRLERLREVKANPESVLAKLRFSIRDTRLLLRSGSPQPWGGRFDVLARELVAVENLLDGPHPDFYGFLTRADRLQTELDRLVADFRASLRPGETNR